MKLLIQHGQNTFQIQAETDELVGDLMARLETVHQCGVLARHQKLILKGKVLDSRATLSEANIRKDGAKIMLIASAGGGPTQGQLAAREAAKQKAAAVKDRVQGLLSSRRQGDAAWAPAERTWQERAEVWSKTGIMSLRDAGMRELPEGLLQQPGALSTIRTADLGGNALTALPASVANLTALMRLRLSCNALTSQGVPWGELASLQHLRVLALDHNKLTELPGTLGALPSLQALSVAHNQLTSLPAELGRLSALQRLDARGNCLDSLPAELAGCAALSELDAAQNRLSDLPAALGGLINLRALLLDDNRLGRVPSAILKGCTALARLSLHGNPITIEQLREADGFAEFNARRCAKADKQLEMQVLRPSSGFDEGADHVEWQSWGAAAKARR